MGITSEHICSLINKQVNENILVVWYDPSSAYADAVALDLPKL